MDAICIGESMVVVSPDPPQPISAATHAALSCAGAESNVAINLARLGLHVGWRGRLGCDPFAGIITDSLEAAGVDTDMIEYDASAPTGIYFKDPHPSGTRTWYYRSTSAASFMDTEFVDCLPQAQLWHLSGITPALSDSCRRLTEKALTSSEAPLLSFDVNYRPSLWESPETAAACLRTLANHADLCFVGLDEAYCLWGTDTPTQVREVLSEPGTVIIKDAEHGATAVNAAGEHHFVATQPVPVREPVGAGDAFAAGYLYGLLIGTPLTTSLKLGHLLARYVLTVPGDIGPLPPPDAIAELLS